MQLAWASGKLLAAALGRHGTPLAFGAGVVGAAATNIYHDAGRTESVRLLVGWLDAFVFDFVERAAAAGDWTLCEFLLLAHRKSLLLAGLEIPGRAATLDDALRHVESRLAAAEARRPRLLLLVGAMGCLVGAVVLLRRARRRRARRRPRDAGADGDARWRSHNPRVVLGVGPFASRAACRAAYLRLARLYHLEKSGNAATSEAFRAVVAAWHAVS
jgi:hypothetical protein